MRLNWKNWRVALVTLCLLATGTVQLAAATHWHPAAPGASASTSPQSPAGHPGDSCLLCKVSAHLASAAPPPSPWVLLTEPGAHPNFKDATQCSVATVLSSHAWQGRAPPRA